MDAGAPSSLLAGSMRMRSLAHPNRSAVWMIDVAEPAISPASHWMRHQEGAAHWGCGLCSAASQMVVCSPAP